jgi:hypothetical protein
MQQQRKILKIFDKCPSSISTQWRNWVSLSDSSDEDEEMHDNNEPYELIIGALWNASWFPLGRYYHFYPEFDTDWYVEVIGILYKVLAFDTITLTFYTKR